MNGEPSGKDAWEDWAHEFYSPILSKSLKTQIRLTYRDAEGQVTHRTVDTEKFFVLPSGAGGVMGFCHLRQQRRPFRFERILHVAHPATGHVITNLGGWLTAQYASTPDAARDIFLESHEAALVALFYVAKADDVFRQKEKDVVRRFLIELGLSDADAQTLVLHDMATWVPPSAIGYGKALTELNGRSQEYLALVLESAKAIVATDKTVRDDEIRALKRMEKSFSTTPTL